MLFRLLAIPNLQVFVNAPLTRYTRFEIGGPARALLDAADENSLVQAWRAINDSRWPRAVIGGGTNLIASDCGFPGAVLRYTANSIEFDGATVRAGAGTVLQDLVDAANERGLQGMETMTGIPGWLGGAIYGNAGAYGRSIQESVVSVRFFDGESIREIDGSRCEFRYRESIFKRQKDWIVLSAVLQLKPASAKELQDISSNILKIRNAKYPPEMRCAGSIFKNLFLADLPEAVRGRIPEGVIREGKVPSAWFLEQAGAKGLGDGPIRVADYHANLIYNTGGGSSRELRALIAELKRRVLEKFCLELEEEVQFL